MRKGKRMVIGRNFDEEYPGEAEEHMRMVAADPDILFVAKSVDGLLIKGIVVPGKSIDDDAGPIIFPGAEENMVLAAFSREFIQEMADKIALIPGEEMQETAWEMFLELASQEAGREYEENPPQKLI
jgi:hypothetical protein